MDSINRSTSSENLPKAPPESAPTANFSAVKAVGRRELLKTLAISGGALTISPLAPETWLPPVIETRSLPPHAQISTLTIADLRVAGPLLDTQSANGPRIFGPSGASEVGLDNDIISYVYRASFSYNDPLGLVNANTILNLTERYHPSNSVISDSTSLSYGNISGDGLSGMVEEIIFSVFYGPFQPGCGLICQGDSTSDTEVNLAFFIETTDGRRSNVLEVNRPRPAS